MRTCGHSAGIECEGLQPVHANHPGREHGSAEKSREIPLAGYRVTPIRLITEGIESPCTSSVNATSP